MEPADSSTPTVCDWAIPASTSIERNRRPKGWSCCLYAAWHIYMEQTLNQGTISRHYERVNRLVPWEGRAAGGLDLVHVHNKYDMHLPCDR